MASSSPSVPASPSPDRRTERKLQIIEAAARLFAELGYSDCEMERVAQELKIAKGTLYLYFPGKKDLFFACVDLAMTQLTAAIRAAADGTSDPIEKISRAIRAYLVFFSEHPQYVELLIQERAIFRDRKQSTYFNYREGVRVDWRELYASLIKENRFRPELVVEEVMDVIGHLVYGTMFTNHFLARATDIDVQHRVLLDVVLRGLLSDDERGRQAAAAN